MLLVTLLAVVQCIYGQDASEYLRNKDFNSNRPVMDTQCPCSVTVLYNTVLVDCSGRSLTSLLSSWFPENTTDLMLQNNKLTRIRNDTFQNLHQLERLSLQFNVLSVIEPNAFQHLENLHYLNLECNKLDLFRLPTDTFRFLINLRELRLNQMHKELIRRKTFAMRNASFPDGMFGSLINLTIFDSALGSFEELKHVIYDRAHMGLHVALNTLRPLVNTNITFLRISYAHLTPHLPYLSITTKDGVLNSQSTQYLQEICVEEVNPRTSSKNEIKEIYGSLLTTELRIELKSLTSFTRSETVRNKFRSLVTENVTSLIDHEPNGESRILPDSAALTTETNSSRLPNELIVYITESLEYMDVSSLSSRVLLNVKYRVYGVLSISGNRFGDIPFDLTLTPYLNYLDLRKNAIQSISKSNQDKMDRQREVLGTFQLLLEGNTLSCGCANLEFLQWLLQTKVLVDGNRNFTCISNDGFLSFTLAYDDISGFWRKCWAQTYLFISIVLLCVTVVGYLLVFVWTKNKIFIMSRIFQIFTGFKINKASDYRYGVFIGYCDSDYTFACYSLRNFIENELGLLTFICDRDLSPSAPFAQGIMEAINSSWRVVLVINESFLNQNEWLLFSIRSAIYSISPSNPSRVVILVERKYVNSVPSELWSSVPEDSVIVVNRWQMTYDMKQKLRTRLLAI
ncbi:hypothetical protein Btru_032582 [Bulinus truncatus]|nr:hypothetical protein Btru_032582 [Bulinus truncatus]